MKQMLFAVLALVIGGCGETDSAPATQASNNSQAVQSLMVKDTSVTLEHSTHNGVLHFPLVSSPVDDRELDSLIYTHLSIYNIIDQDLNALKEEFKASGSGLTNMEYTVNFNEKGVFDASFDLTATAAHYSYSFVNVSLDLVGKKQIFLVDLLDKGKLDGFLFDCNAKLSVNIEASRTKTAKEINDELILDLFSGHKVEESNLTEFSITKNGINVYYDFFFPHYAKAYEPNGLLTFSWEECKKYFNLKDPVVTRLLAENMAQL